MSLSTQPDLVSKATSDPKQIVAVPTLTYYLLFLQLFVVMPRSFPYAAHVKRRDKPSRERFWDRPGT